MTQEMLPRKLRKTEKKSISYRMLRRVAKNLLATLLINYRVFGGILWIN